MYVPQYPTGGGTDTMREYLETHSDKLISSNSLRDLASIILENNYFENEELKYHQKRGFTIGTKFAFPYSNLFMAGLEKSELVSLNLSCGYETLRRFFVYGPEISKN